MAAAVNDAMAPNKLNQGWFLIRQWLYLRDRNISSLVFLLFLTFLGLQRNSLILLLIPNPHPITVFILVCFLCSHVNIACTMWQWLYLRDRIM